MSFDVLHDFFIDTTTYANFEIITLFTDTPKDGLSSLTAAKRAVELFKELHKYVIIGTFDLVLWVACPTQIIVTSACSADPVVLLSILSANITELGLMITVVLGFAYVLVVSWLLLIEYYWSGLESVRLVVRLIRLPLAVVNMFTGGPLLMLYTSVANVIVALLTVVKVQPFFLCVQALDAAHICVGISLIIFQSRFEVIH